MARKTCIANSPLANGKLYLKKVSLHAGATAIMSFGVEICRAVLILFNVGYRMFFHDRARGEAECEIMKKTFYNVGYYMVWLLTYFQIFFKTESSSFSEKLDSNYT